jgi:hypothetical protein
VSDPLASFKQLVDKSFLDKGVLGIYLVGLEINLVFYLYRDRNLSKVFTLIMTP